MAEQKKVINVRIPTWTRLMEIKVRTGNSMDTIINNAIDGKKQ